MDRVLGSSSRLIPALERERRYLISRTRHYCQSIRHEDESHNQQLSPWQRAVSRCLNPTSSATRKAA